MFKKAFFLFNEGIPIYAYCDFLQYSLLAYLVKNFTLGELEC